MYGKEDFVFFEDDENFDWESILNSSFEDDSEGEEDEIIPPPTKKAKNISRRKPMPAVGRASALSREKLTQNILMLLLTAIDVVLGDSIYSLSEDGLNALEILKVTHSRLSEVPKWLETFIWDALTSGDKKTLPSAQVEGMWSQFHLLRTQSEFTKKGITFLAEITGLQDSMDTKLYSSFVDKPSMSNLEQQALRYVGGAMCRKLSDKCKKNKPHYSDIIKTMMMEKGSQAAGYLKNTCKWVNTLDRGGLFHISDELFLFLRLLEEIVSKQFSTPTLIHYHHGNLTSPIWDSALKNSLLLSYWEKLTTGATTKVKMDLMYMFIRLYITIRGNSFRRKLLEKYQQITKTTLKEKGLRKSLKNKSSSK